MASRETNTPFGEAIVSMSTQTSLRVEGRTDTGIGILLSGGIAGLVAAAVMAPVWIYFRPFIVTNAAAALYNLQGSLMGWVVHLVHGTVFGVLFAFLVTKSPLGTKVGGVSRSVASGMAYSLVLWVVGAGIVLPLGLLISDVPAAPLVPNLHPAGLAAHLVYGAVLGLLVPPLLSATAKMS